MSSTGDNGASRLAELERAANLHERGALTDAEFAREKSRILGTGEPGSRTTQPPDFRVPPFQELASKWAAVQEGSLRGAEFAVRKDRVLRGWNWSTVEMREETLRELQTLVEHGIVLEGDAEWVRERLAAGSSPDRQSLTPKGMIASVAFVGLVVAFGISDSGKARRSVAPTAAAASAAAAPAVAPAVRRDAWEVKVHGASKATVNGRAKARKGNIFLTFAYEVRNNTSQTFKDPLLPLVLVAQDGKEYRNRNQTGADKYEMPIDPGRPQNTWVTFEIPKRVADSPMTFRLPEPVRGVSFETTLQPKTLIE